MLRIDSFDGRTRLFNIGNIGRFRQITAEVVPFAAESMAPGR